MEKTLKPKKDYYSLLPKRTFQPSPEFEAYHEFIRGLRFIKYYASISKNTQLSLSAKAIVSYLIEKRFVGPNDVDNGADETLFHKSSRTHPKG